MASIGMIIKEGNKLFCNMVYGEHISGNILVVDKDMHFFNANIISIIPISEFYFSSLLTAN